MEKISLLRRKIDRIDDHILTFLKKRVEICKSIGKIKRESGMPIRDLEREKERYSYITTKAGELELDPQKIKAIYTEIISACIAVQK
ncbi:MAG: chorismate mutase [Thermoproteota archaeon]